MYKFSADHKKLEERGWQFEKNRACSSLGKNHAGGIM